jgi:hypothetical protein
VTTFSLSLDNILLIAHVGATVIAYGIMLAYPILVLVGRRTMNPQGLSLFHRSQQQIIRRIVAPGLAAIAASGAVLSEDAGATHAFYAHWGVFSAIVLALLASVYLGPREGRLADLADRDLRSPEGVLSIEYKALGARVRNATLLTSALVLVTIVIMVAHT